MKFLRKNGADAREANQYATSEDFDRIFAEDMDRLHQLSFLLTRDQEKAEKCFVTGLEDSVKSNRVFREWARSWAKRNIIQSAIRELRPGPKPANSFSSVTAFPYVGELSGSRDRHFEVDSVLELEDFERFVFVMSILEHYSDYDCTVLLGCTRRDIEEARTRALAYLTDPHRTVSSCQTRFEEVQEINR
jgi:hypothetical protein